MLEMRESKSESNIHLMAKVQCFIDLALEQDKDFSDNFKCFLEEPNHIHQSVLPELKVPEFDNINKFDAVSQQWSFSRDLEHSKYSDGFIICLSIPLKEPDPKDDTWCKVHHDQLSFFWFYGNTYEEALKSGMEYLIYYSNRLYEAMKTPKRSTSYEISKSEPIREKIKANSLSKISKNPFKRAYLHVLHKLNMYFTQLEKKNRA